tara:strand:- start:266 stop:742 length:477 start_codon:yes stop_codon:yes gene_type:complete
MYKKIIISIFISQLFVACGFKPIYKITNNQMISSSISYQIQDSASYELQQILIKRLSSEDSEIAKYIVKLSINEQTSAVNVLSNGSVSEYRVEVLINYTIINNQSDVNLYSSKSRGFANYDSSNSEYKNDLMKKEALEKASSDAIRLMQVLIQNKINE